MSNSTEKSNSLDEHIKAFEEKKAEFLRDNEGRYAVGRADTGFTFWDTHRDALQCGYEKYGPHNFLIRRVERFEMPSTLTRDIFSVHVN